MNLIKKIWKKFIDKYYYLATSISCILITIYFYKTSGLSIFNGIYIILGIYSVFNFFNKEYKIFNIIPKNKFILLISLIFITSMTHVYYDHDYIVRSQNTEGTSISDAILVKPIESNINISEGNFDAIKIQFATYKRENKKGFYNITLNKNGNPIFTRNYNASEFKDSVMSEMYVGKQVANKNDKFTLVIKPIYADSDNCISIYQNKKTNIINYQVIDNSLNTGKEIMIASFLIIFVAVNYIINTKELKPEKAYLLLALYFIPLIFVVPSYDIPDEPGHYLRAYKLSLITNKDIEVSNINSTYIYAPNIECLSYGQFQNANSHFNSNKYIKCIKESKNIKQYNYSINNTSSANPISHIIPAIGIKAADAFSNSTLKIFMAGRLMNCLLSIIGISYAIKKAKKNKLLLLFIATIPMFVQQMISYSYDSLLNTSCIIVTALIINILCKVKLKKKDYIIFSMCLTYIACSKYLYLLLIAPLLFVNKNKSNIKEYIKQHSYIVYIMIMPILMFLVWKLFGITAIQTSSSNVQSQSNISYIISNPLKLASIAVNTIKINGWFYIQSLFGYFGWFIFRFDNYIYIIYVLMIIILLKNNKTSESILDKKGKIISVISILIMIAGVFASMYFFWSSYKLNYVDGVQGRYFIPLMGLLLLVCIPKKKKDLKIDKNDFYIFANLSLIVYAITLICNIY